jgi:hemoglobin-like flavoprotein
MAEHQRTSEMAMKSGDGAVQAAVKSAADSAVIDLGFESQEAVLTLISESWDAINKKGGKDDPAHEGGEQEIVKKQDPSAAKKKSSWFSWGSSSKSDGYTTAAEGAEISKNKEAASKAQGEKQFDIPETFTEMVRLNAAMTGAKMEYINIMLDEFNNLVRDICKLGQLQEQTDILAMRIAKDTKGQTKTSEFKVCMLAAMRSLIPQRWDTQHEKAWSWLWDSIDTQLKLSLPLPAKYEIPVTRWVKEVNTPEQLGEIGLKVWYRMFAKEPKVEDVFKQSNERLKWIAVQAMLYSSAIYADPTAMNIQMQALALKHIMFKVNPAYFPLFVECIDEEVRSMCDDPMVVDGMNWSLTIIACILSRGVEAGSTPLLMAALNNNVKQLKGEMAAIPRGQRGMAMLIA